MFLIRVRNRYTKHWYFFGGPYPTMAAAEAQVDRRLQRPRNQRTREDFEIWEARPVQREYSIVLEDAELTWLIEELEEVASDLDDLSPAEDSLLAKLKAARDS